MRTVHDRIEQIIFAFSVMFAGLFFMATVVFGLFFFPRIMVIVLALLAGLLLAAND